jgi:hypothetical protein
MFLVRRDLEARGLWKTPCSQVWLPSEQPDASTVVDAVQRYVSALWASRYRQAPQAKHAIKRLLREYVEEKTWQAG